MLKLNFAKFILSLKKNKILKENEILKTGAIKLNYNYLKVVLSKNKTFSRGKFEGKIIFRQKPSTTLAQ